MQPLPQNIAFIIIDVQKGFDDPIWGRRNNLHADGIVCSMMPLDGVKLVRKSGTFFPVLLSMIDRTIYLHVSLMTDYA